MKVGDLAKIIGTMSDADTIGTVIEPWENINGYDGHDWWTVIIGTGELISWPESQMEKINENR